MCVPSMHSKTVFVSIASNEDDYEWYCPWFGANSIDNNNYFKVFEYKVLNIN